MSTLVDRFFRYVQMDTQSNLDSTTQPSTAKQYVLAKLLVQELIDLGLKDAVVDDHCYVMASLPSNLEKPAPAIGLIAHLDTSPDASGTDVQPRIHPGYDGKDLLLDVESRTVLSPADFPELLKYVGQDLITAGGKTLLGADDKAGIAIIMSVLEHLSDHPEQRHGKLCIGFNPDEEVGRGADHFDVARFGADFAYTIDGGEIGELEYECFNASMARIHIQGRNVHPGKAKGAMVNSIQLGMDLHAMLPVDQRPEFTAHYEGFFHLTNFKGTAEETDMIYILRDHDQQKFRQKEQLLKRAVDFLNQQQGEERIRLTLIPQYQNMRTVLENSMHIVDTAREAMVRVGVEPIIRPIRGGTDGSRLSFMGLPTPNIFTGGHNYHGRYEFIPVQSMQRSVQVLLQILEIYAE